MLAFWDDLLEPLLVSLRPAQILEIGSDQGATTRALLRFAEAHGAVLHSIDPKPNFDIDQLKREHPNSLVFYKALSLQVLPDLEPVDLALIDGDHNWYTVLNELRLLEKRAVAEGAHPPVVALHDIGWPYGRRDLYYDPDTIPADQRRPFERRGIAPDSDELVDDGINGHLANAKLPAEQHSGVLGAIEDFLEESKQNWRLFKVPGQHGLGVLAVEEVLSERGRTNDLLKETSGVDFLQNRAEIVERDRIAREMARTRTNRTVERLRAELDEGRGAEQESMVEDLAAAQVAASEATKALAAIRDELEDAERRILRVKRQRDAAEEREAELENLLADERRKSRFAREDVDAAEERRERDSRRVPALEEKVETVRKEAEAAATQLRLAEEKTARLQTELEQAAVARARLVADFEDSRESLERKIDDLRAQADTGRHAAAEMRESLEERELEMQRLNTQLLNLQTALGRSRADAEIAETEKAAFERRLGEAGGAPRKRARGARGWVIVPGCGARGGETDWDRSHRS